MNPNALTNVELDEVYSFVGGKPTIVGTLTQLAILGRVSLAFELSGGLLSCWVYDGGQAIGRSSEYTSVEDCLYDILWRMLLSKD